MTSELTAERLREVLAYDPQTGAFVWLQKATKFSNVKVGDAAGSRDGGGYLRIRVGGRKYKAHRLAWLHFYGAWPAENIDHIDGNGENNAIANLRDVTQSLNAQNIRGARADGSTGLLGVSACGSGFRAKIQVGNQGRWLGTFDTPEEAHAAYITAKRQLHAGCTI